MTGPTDEQLTAPPVPMMKTKRGPRVVVLFVAFLMGVKATALLLVLRYGIWRAAAVAVVAYGMYKTVWKLPSSPQKLCEAEDRLLLSIPGVEHTKRSVMVNGMTINSVCFKSADAGSGPKKVLVMLHGLGAGLGVWAKNVPELCKTRDVWCIDLLGFGRSSSPRFDGKSQEDALKWWTDSIHAWRVETLGEDTPIDLVGHSLGGFIAAAYALVHDVDKLVLAAPVGISSISERLAGLPLAARISFRLLHALRFTRTKMTRVLGPVADVVVRSIITRRASWYGYTSPELIEYVFHLQCAEITGEDAFLATVCPVSGWKQPLLTQLGGLKAKQLNLIYGERDFVEAVADEEISKHTAIPTNVTALEGIGHHMYTTVPSVFNSHVLA